jgi:hypothetical protein
MFFSPLSKVAHHWSQVLLNHLSLLLYSRFLQVSLKIANLVDDATPDLSDNIKLFLIKLLEPHIE